MDRLDSARRFRGGLLVSVIVVLAIVALNSCSSTTSSGGTTGDSSSSSTKSSTTEPAWLAADKAALQKGIAGDFDLPPTSGPKAQRGKKVWFISCGQIYISCAMQSTAFAAAGKALGWNVSIQDGKADPTTAANLIRSAIAAKANGVAVSYFDCPGIKSALLAAKSAGMPVVAMGSLDCNSPFFGGHGQPLFTATLNLRGSTNPANFYAAWTRATVQYMIAQSNGKANVLGVMDVDQAIHEAQAKAAQQEFAKCTTCTYKQFSFTFSQVPNPFTADLRSAILANPQVDIVYNAIDSMLSLGVATAVQGAGRKLPIYGSELYPPNIVAMRKGIQTTASATPQDWFSWGLADTLNRVFAGENPSTFPSEGEGWQYVDLQHNMPKGIYYEPPVNFKADYEKVWAGT